MIGGSSVEIEQNPCHALIGIFRPNVAHHQLAQRHPAHVQDFSAIVVHIEIFQCHIVNTRVSALDNSLVADVPAVFRPGVRAFACSGPWTMTLEMVQYVLPLVAEYRIGFVKGSPFLDIRKTGCAEVPQ